MTLKRHAEPSASQDESIHSWPPATKDQQPAAGVAYTHPTTVASYTVHQAPVAAHTVAAAYAPTAAAVAVARPAPVAVAAATAAAYGGYQPTHATTDYGYPQRQAEVPPPPPPVTSQNYQVPSTCAVVKLHTKLGKPIPSTEPSMVTQTSSSSAAVTGKTTLTSSSTTSSLCLSSTTSSNSSAPYLKAVNITSSGVVSSKNPVPSSLSAANSASAGKKVNTPRINFVG
ncbi:hypothetical protein GOODEAATRI_008546 [Goodea atripinnis]|uniref:Uncharacterized protein n=1 Tax=Goodea atripinnis TaxID=208336 RepID=A0ABV0PCH0_9TELE